MIEIEKFKCNDNHEASARERYWYEMLNSTVNMKIPNRSSKEYRSIYYSSQEKLDHCHNVQRKYYQENKQLILQCRKEKFKCSCGSLCRISDKSSHFKTKKHQSFINSQDTNL